MTNEEIRSGIATAMETQWGGSYLIAYPNRPADPAGTGTLGTETYLEFTIRFGDTELGEMGDDGVGIRKGVLFVRSFSTPGIGTKVILDLHDAIEVFFKRNTTISSNLIFDDPSTSEDGINPEDKYQVTTKVAFSAFDS